MDTRALNLIEATCLIITREVEWRAGEAEWLAQSAQVRTYAETWFADNLVDEQSGVRTVRPPAMSARTATSERGNTAKAA